MSSYFRASWIATLLVLVLSAAVHWTHLRLVQLQGSRTAGAQSSRPILPKAEVLKMVSLGYEQLVADIWWLAFIQYYGDSGERLKDGFKWSYNYLDLITSLDPQFTQPYWFSAFAVGAEMKRPDLAARLIERGIQANPDSWYIPFIAGINQYLFARCDACAARYYRMAARLPDAPDWVARQADILAARMPSLLKTIATWQAVYESAGSSLVRARARDEMIRLWIRVYREVPSEFARFRACEELKALGFDLSTAGLVEPKMEGKHK